MSEDFEVVKTINEKYYEKNKLKDCLMSLDNSITEEILNLNDFKYMITQDLKQYYINKKMTFCLFICSKNIDFNCDLFIDFSKLTIGMSLMTEEQHDNLLFILSCSKTNIYHSIDEHLDICDGFEFSRPALYISIFKDTINKLKILYENLYRIEISKYIL